MLFLLFQRWIKNQIKIDAARFLDARGDEKQVINLERPYKQFSWVSPSWINSMSKQIIRLTIWSSCRRQQLILVASFEFCNTCTSGLWHQNKMTERVIPLVVTSCWRDLWRVVMGSSCHIDIVTSYFGIQEVTWDQWVQWFNSMTFHIPVLRIIYDPAKRENGSLCVHGGSRAE